MMASRRPIVWTGVGLLLYFVLMPDGPRGLARGADEKPASPPAKRTLEDQVSESIRQALNEGADIYNGPRGEPRDGDPKGCVLFFRGALKSVKPLLGDHPSLQTAIDKALADAQKLPNIRDEAWLLREVLVDVRSGLKKMPSVPDVVEVKPVDGKSLWDRLGGEKGVTQIVNAAADWSIADPDVNFFRNGKIKKTPAEITVMKRQMVILFSQIGRGPLTGQVPTMKRVHLGMNITNEEFDAFKGHLKKSLLRHVVNEQDREILLAMVESTRKDIVATDKGPIPPATLWDRLGGEKETAKIVNDWIEAAVADPQVNFFRNGTIKKTPAEIAEIKKHFVALASALGDGPIKYEGRRMAEIHKGMNVTDAEFDALLGHLNRSLKRNKVSQDDVDAVLKAVEGTRRSIVPGKAAAPAPPPEARRREDNIRDAKRADDPTSQFLAGLIRRGIDWCFSR